jgi:hypothetical protein
VIRKNTLPEGWLVFLDRAKSGELNARPVCPDCNRAEIARWNPEQ